MTRFYRVQTRMAYDAGPLNDGSVNTMHFMSDEVGSLADDLLDLVTGVGAAYQAFDQNLSENLSGALDIFIYDMEDPPQRVPAEINNVVLTPAATANANQLAVVVGLDCSQISGQPRGRRRGRLYIGPVSGGADTDDVGDVIVSTAVRDSIGNAFGAWIPTFPTPTSLSTITWCVFSVSDALGLAVGQEQPAQEPTFTPAQLAAGYHPIIRVRIRNRFGIQRRRRLAPTAFSDYS